MIFGCDFLGGARYAKTVLSEQPRAYGFGIFADVDGFGKAYKLIEQVAALKVPFIRVQLMWKDDHNFRPSDIPEVRNRAKQIHKIAQKYPSIKWYVSPICEHNLKESQWLDFAHAVRANCPNALVVNSPNNGKGFVSKTFINEYHHEERPRKGGKCAFSFDGANIVDSNIEAVKANYQAANAEYIMIWNSQCNGRRNLEDKTPRKDRKFWPTDKQIDSWIYTTTHSKGATKLPKDWIFKSHSDQHTVPPSGKDQKPVWVKLPKFRAIEVKARNGQLIDKANYFGTFTGGGHRYYHTDWGFSLSEKAKRIQGDGVCDVFADGKKVGTVNLAFRDGSYR